MANTDCWGECGAAAVGLAYTARRGTATSENRVTACAEDEHICVVSTP